MATNLPTTESAASPGFGAKTFAAFHRADRNFFLIFLIVCWLGVLMGFAPAVTKRMAGEAQYAAPLILQIHAFAFVGWLAMLTIQIVLVRRLRTHQHKLLGLAGFALLPLMLVSGYVSEIFGQRFRFDHGNNDFPFFVIIPIFDFVALGMLALIALLIRKNPPAHKRMILLATTVIVGAAYARWWGDALLNAFGDDFGGMMVNTFTGTNLILAGAVAYDLATRGRVHSVYLLGVPAIIAGELATSLIYHAPGWLPIAGALVGR